MNDIFVPSPHTKRGTEIVLIMPLWIKLLGGLWTDNSLCSLGLSFLICTRIYRKFFQILYQKLIRHGKVIPRDDFKEHCLRKQFTRFEVIQVKQSVGKLDPWVLSSLCPLHIQNAVSCPSSFLNGSKIILTPSDTPLIPCILQSLRVPLVNLHMYQTRAHKGNIAH